MGVAELRIKEAEQLIEEAEQYSRRHSLRLNGLEVQYNESAADVLNLVKKEIKRMNLSIQDFEVDRTHRNGRSYTDKDGNKKQTVLVKYTSGNARNKFYKVRKHSNFHIKPDLSSKRNEVSNHIRDEINNQTSTASKLFNHVFVDANCNVMVFTRRGRFLKCNSKDEYLSALFFIGNNEIEDMFKDLL